MSRWTARHVLRPVVIMSRKLSYLATLFITLFLIIAYLQQNRITEYSRYNWLQSGNRELLSLQNSANYKQTPNSTTHLGHKIDTLNTNAIIINGAQKNVERLSTPSAQTATTDSTATTTTTTTTGNTCEPKYNIVFLKTHKCASSTIQNIFMRNGFIHNKVFVLPAKANYLGHPMPFTEDLVPDPKQFKHEYNILTHHSRLNYQSMRSLMPNGTLFITIVRDPVDLFESMFHYYRLDRFWNMTFDTFGNQSIKIPDRLRTNRYIGKIGINQMMFDLGMNITDFTKPYTLKKYIHELDSIFDLVMVSEHMDESLVLLKHLLCWSTDDIIAFKLNARLITAKRNLTETAIYRIRDLNWADHQLYKYFKQKFSLIVKAFGSERMSREVSELHNRTNEWFDFCVGKKNETQNKVNTNNTNVIIKLTNRQTDNTTCWLLTALEMDFTKFLRMRQMKAFPGSVFKELKPLPKLTMQTMTEKRRQYLRSKLLLLSPTHRRNVCKNCMTTSLLTLPMTAATREPQSELEIALKNVTFIS